VLSFAQHPHLFSKTGAKAILLRFQIVTSLEIQPEAFGRAEVPGQSQGRVGRHGALAEHDLVDAPWWDADILGELILAYLERLQETISTSWASPSFQRKQIRH
jgi:hypothetical protein